MEIKLDDLDIKILKIFFDLEEGERTGTRLITRFLFPDLGKGALRSKEMFINYKIKRLNPFIKVEKIDGGFYEYTLQDNVQFKKYKFSEKKEDIKECLLLNNGKRIIIEL